MYFILLFLWVEIVFSMRGPFFLISSCNTWNWFLGWRDLFCVVCLGYGVFTFLSHNYEMKRSLFLNVDVFVLFGLKYILWNLCIIVTRGVPYKVTVYVTCQQLSLTKTNRLLLFIYFFSFTTKIHFHFSQMHQQSHFKVILNVTSAVSSKKY